MKKTTSVLSIAFLAAGMLFTNSAITNSGGVPSPLSGSPQSSGTCANCHSGGSITSQDLTITTDIPADGFMANTDYIITVKGVGNGGTANKGGFNATVEDGSGFVGTLATVSGGGAQIGGNSATHVSSNNTFTGDTLVYKFKWNSGNSNSATVYAAFNFANGNGNTGGDAVKTETLILSKNTIGLKEFSVSSMRAYPNPAVEMLNLDFTVSTAENLNVNLSDLSGRFAIELYNGLVTPGPVSLAQNINELPVGVYILTIEYGGNVYHEKVVKQ